MESLPRDEGMIGTALAIVLVGGIVFIGLLLITPSVGTAPELVGQLDREHHAAELRPPQVGAVSAMQPGRHGAGQRASSPGSSVST
jgi:hypothetical protein